MITLVWRDFSEVWSHFRSVRRHSPVSSVVSASLDDRTERRAGGWEKHVGRQYGCKVARAAEVAFEEQTERPSVNGHNVLTVKNVEWTIITIVQQTVEHGGEQ